MPKGCGGNINSRSITEENLLSAEYMGAFLCFEDVFLKSNLESMETRVILGFRGCIFEELHFRCNFGEFSCKNGGFSCNFEAFSCKNHQFSCNS